LQLKGCILILEEHYDRLQHGLFDRSLMQSLCMTSRNRDLEVGGDLLTNMFQS